MIPTDKLATLDLSVLLSLHTAVGSEIARRHQATTTVARSALRYGDLATFFSKRRSRHVTIRVDKINSVNVSGTELSTGTKWRVHPSYLTKLEPTTQTPRTPPVIGEKPHQSVPIVDPMRLSADW
jgi:hypothetical protein